MNYEIDGIITQCNIKKGEKEHTITLGNILIMYVENLNDESTPGCLSFKVNSNQDISKLTFLYYRTNDEQLDIQALEETKLPELTCKTNQSDDSKKCKIYYTFPVRIFFGYKYDKVSPIMIELSIPHKDIFEITHDFSYNLISGTKISFSLKNPLPSPPQSISFISNNNEEFPAIIIPSSSPSNLIFIIPDIEDGDYKLEIQFNDLSIYLQEGIVIQGSSFTLIDTEIHLIKSKNPTENIIKINYIGNITNLVSETIHDKDETKHIILISNRLNCESNNEQSEYTFMNKETEEKQIVKVICDYEEPIITYNKQIINYEDNTLSIKANIPETDNILIEIGYLTSNAALTEPNDSIIYIKPNENNEYIFDIENIYEDQKIHFYYKLHGIYEYPYSASNAYIVKNVSQIVENKVGTCKFKEIEYSLQNTIEMFDGTLLNIEMAEINENVYDVYIEGNILPIIKGMIISTTNLLTNAEQIAVLGANCFIYLGYEDEACFPKNYNYYLVHSESRKKVENAELLCSKYSCVWPNCNEGDYYLMVDNGTKEKNLIEDVITIAFSSRRLEMVKINNENINGYLYHKNLRTEGNKRN